MKKVLFILFVVIILVLIGFVVVKFFLPKDDKETVEDNIPIMNQFDKKIVYGISGSLLDLEVIRDDCDKRGGIFDECGTTCASNAKACDTVCALTCEGF